MRKMINVLRITMIAFAMMMAAGAAWMIEAPDADGPVFAEAAYAADEDAYTYTITVYSGKEGYFDGDTSKHAKTLTKSAAYGSAYTIAMDELDLTLVESDKYYSRGVKRAGHDNDEVSRMTYQSYTFTVTKDESFTVAYGMKGGMVAYTVRYVDKSGNPLQPARTYYGMAGDKPVVSCKYVDGYLPETLNISKTLVADESQNVFTFVYSKNEGVVSGEDAYAEEDADDGDDRDGGDGDGNRNGAAGNGNAGAGGNAPGAYTAGDGDNGPAGLTDMDDGQTPLTDIGEEDVPKDSGFFSGITGLMAGIIALGILIALLLLYFILRKRGEEED